VAPTVTSIPPSRPRQGPDCRSPCKAAASNGNDTQPSCASSFFCAKPPAAELRGSGADRPPGITPSTGCVQLEDRGTAVLTCPVSGPILLYQRAHRGHAVHLWNRTALYTNWSTMVAATPSPFPFTPLSTPLGPLPSTLFDISIHSDVMHGRSLSRQSDTADIRGSVLVITKAVLYTAEILMEPCGR